MLSCQSHHFSLESGVHYLNCAYMSPLPKAVEQVGLKAVSQKNSPWKITPTDFFTHAEQVRKLSAQVIHCPDFERIALIPAVSYGMAIVAKNLPLRKGQNIVVLHEQFPSNVYAWQTLAAERQAEVRTVMPPEGFTDRGKIWNERLLEAIDAQTALVAVPHVHWADGTVFDLEAVSRRVRTIGAWFVIDGTQSVGAKPIDVQSIRPDALICAGYKWLLGPYGTGVAYLGERLDGGKPLEENWINRLGSEDFSRLVQYEAQYQPKALRYDMGERSNFILLPMLAKALELLLEWQVAEIHQYCTELMRPYFPKLQGLGYRIEEEGYRAAHLFGIRLPKHIQIAKLQQTLAEHRISVSFRGEAIRVAPNIYNDKADVERLLHVLSLFV
jgi:selenocysteine lyase/cysteine desulfurase